MLFPDQGRQRHDSFGVNLPRCRVLSLLFICQDVAARTVHPVVTMCRQAVDTLIAVRITAVGGGEMSYVGR